MTNTIQFTKEEALKRHRYLYGNSKYAVLFDTTGIGQYVFQVYRNGERYFLSPKKEGLPGWEKGQSLDLFRFVAEHTPGDVSIDSPEMEEMLEVLNAIKDGMTSLIDYLLSDGAIVELPEGWEEELNHADNAEKENANG